MLGLCTGILLPKHSITGFHFQQNLSDGITRKRFTGSNGTDTEPAQNCNKPLRDLKLDYKCSWLLKARQEKQTGVTNLLLSSNKTHFNIFPGKSTSSLNTLYYTSAFNSAADLDSCTLIYLHDSYWKLSKIWNTVSPHGDLEPLHPHLSPAASLNTICHATGRHSLHW